MICYVPVIVKSRDVVVCMCAKIMSFRALVSL